MTIEPVRHHDAKDRTELIQQLLNEYQHNLPLSTTPYADMAKKLGVEESDILDLLRELDEKGILSRVGAVFRPNRVGVSTLAAMAVPEKHLQKIAEIINQYSAVNHNYEREHYFNLWFVVTAENQQQLDATLADMEARTNTRIMSLPMEKDYHIDLGFPLQLIKGGKNND